MYLPKRTHSTLAALTLPVILAGAAWFGPQVLAAAQTQDVAGLGIGGKLPRTIDLAELERRTAERFAELDSNNNGLIDEQEHASAASAHRKGGKHRKGHMHRKHDRKVDEATREEMKAELFARLDSDKNGELSSDEFANRREVRNEIHKERHLAHRFDRLDSNQDDQLSLAEFQQRVEKMRALDSDADGIVTRAELRRGMEERKATRQKRSEQTDRSERQG